MTAAWLVEATLFALTAAITAVLVNLGTSQRDRARVVAQYRSRAFDAVAGFSLFTLLWTGFDVLKVVDAEVTERAFSGPMVSAIAMLVFDIAGLGWLLVFTHHLLARTTSQIASEFSSALRLAFRDMGVHEVADAIFREWGTPLGLETHPFAGFPLSACAVLAPSTGYVDDISLPRLRKWLLSLEGTLGSSRAIMSLGLETFVSQGLQFAAVSELDASRASGSLRAIRWRTGTIYTFDSVLSDLMEGAQAAAREARPASFNAYLEILSNAFHALFDVRAALTPIKASLTTALFGLAPEAQFRIGLRRLGYAVVKSESAEIVGSWIYFVRDVLMRTRGQDRGELHWLFGLWEQLSVSDLPKEVDLWLHLDEYSQNLGIWLATSAHEATLVRVAREASIFIRSLRNMIVAVPLRDTSRIEQLLESLGQHLLRAWPAGRLPANPMEQLQLKVARDLGQLKNLFWLGWMGELCQRFADGVLTADDAVVAWRRNAGRFPSFGDVLEAWLKIALNDALDWQREQSRRQRLEAEEAGRPHMFASVDPYAGTSIVVALLALRIGIQPADPRVGEGAIDQTIEPMFQMIRGGFEWWGPFVGATSPEDLNNRLDSAQNALRAAGHHAAGSREREVAAAAVDTAKVTAGLHGFLAGLDDVGLRLVRRLDEAGLVDWTDATVDLATMRFQVLYPKDSLLSANAVEMVFLGMAPVAEHEDAFILSRLGQPNVREVEGSDAAAQAIDDAIDGFNALGTPATLVVLPWNWSLSTFLLERDGQDASQVMPSGNSIGTYRGVELIRGLQWYHANMCWVVALGHVGRLRIRHGPLPVGRGRLTAEIRPPTEAEVNEWKGQEAPRSRFGFPFTGDDLNAALANRWQLVVTEELTVDDPTPAAVVGIRLLAHSESTPEPSPQIPASGAARKPRSRRRRSTTTGDQTP